MVLSSIEQPMGRPSDSRSMWSEILSNDNVSRWLVSRLIQAFFIVDRNKPNPR